MQHPFESEFADEGTEAMDEFESGEDIEDGFEAAEGGEELDAADEWEDGFEEEAFAEGEDVDVADEWEAGGEEFEEGADVEDVFADAMDAGDEDEFLSRVLSGLGGRAAGMLRGGVGRALRGAGGALRSQIRRRGGLGGIAGRLGQMGGRALARRIGVNPQMGAQLGGQLGGNLGGLLANLMRQAGGGGQTLDAFTDALADASDDEIDEYIPAVAGMAARQVVRATTTPAQRAAQPQRAAQIGRAAMRATTQAARRLVQTGGGQTLRAIGPVVRQVTQVARTQRVQPQAVAPMIRRAAARIAASPRALRRLSRPRPAARQLRRRAEMATRGRATRVIQIPRGQPISIQIGG
jgi:hypothetical protein